MAKGVAQILDVLAASLSVTNQRFRFVILDLFWKFIWLVLTTLIVSFIAVWLVGQIGSTRIEGPDLDKLGPMIWIVVLNEMWSVYGSTVTLAAVLAVLSAGFLWLGLEALFRGGWEQFWVYLGSGAARTAVLCSVGALLGMLMLRDRSADLMALALLLMGGTWFFVTLAETVIRRDAAWVLATDLLPLSAVIAFFQIAEVLTTVILWGAAGTMLLAASEASAAITALVFAGVVCVFWTVIHSFLLSARFSAVDIMRRKIVDG